MIQWIVDPNTRADRDSRWAAKIVYLNGFFRRIGAKKCDWHHIGKDILMAWTVDLLNARVEAELDAQPADIRAKFFRMVELIEQNGIEALRDPFAKHLRGPVWELRLKGKDGIARALYVTTEPERVVVVRVFTKKTQATPKREIELALTRAKEVT